jgi:phosphodiesterase/alkaline phosphatase D-like protein
MKTLKNLIILGAVACVVFAGRAAHAQYTVIPGATEAILNASVNPNGTGTSAWFEYGTDANMVYYTETAHNYVGSSYGDVPFSQKITGLSPNSVYFYRAVANNGTTAKGSIMSFTTVNNNNATTSYTNTVYPVNNVVYTNTNAVASSSNDGVSITNITATGAILNAVLTNPNHQYAQGYFEWGPTTSFGNTTQATDLGTAYTSNFSGTLTQLTPNTTYYFRAVATLNGRTIRGGTRSFQTYATSMTSNYYQSTQAPSVTTNQGQLIQTPVYNTSNTSVLSGSAITSGAFLPNNIFGWLLLLLVILAIVWAARKLSQSTTYVVHK